MKVTFDKSHIWGEFHELYVNNEFIARTIRIYKGSASSIHKHSTQEVLLIESGSVIEWLEDDEGKIQKKIFKKGDIVKVPENRWHRLEFHSSEFKNSEEIKFAQVLELMFGDNKGGNYKITRLEEAFGNKKK